MNFTIIFYETVDGECPVEEFLATLEPKLRAKSVGILEILQEKGIGLREPYTKPLGQGLFELRVKQATNIVRFIYFYSGNRIIIVTHGFVKKTDKTPPKEIATALKRKTDYLKRGGK